MSDILTKTAKKLARIMAEHLATFSPEERKARIAAGDAVLKKRSKSVAGRDARLSGTDRTGSSSARTPRSPLAARGR